MTDLVIAETYIRQDYDGRYCLNDLHRASGGNTRHKPGNWLMLEQTRNLVAQILSDAGNPASTESQPINVVRGGRRAAQGTYVCRELVYAYAMWISSEFALKVIRTYDHVARGQIERLETLRAKCIQAELEYRLAEDAASVGGLAMRRWQLSKPRLKQTVDALKVESQPDFFLI